METIGVLIMAYGGPNNMDEVRPYLLDVRGGRPTSEEIFHEVEERYRQIGGRSPILERTQDQAGAIQAALQEKAGDGQVEFKAYVGMRHWTPYIRQALAQMAADGIQHAVGLVMAPHYSSMSIAVYFKKVEDVGSPVDVSPIRSWHLLPGYLEALANRVRDGLEKFSPAERDDTVIIFSAHSLPQRILSQGDPYRDQLLATVEGVMTLLGPHHHEFAFQSAAMTSEPWLGPDGGQVMHRLAGEGVRNILLAPIGFVVEHVEILYDIDIVYRQLARDLGVHLERIELVNTAPEMIDGLADLALQQARMREWL